MSSSPIPYEEVLSNLKSSTLSLLQGFHAGTPEALLSNTSSAFTYYLHPATVKMAPMTRSEFVNFWQKFMAPNLMNFQPEIHTQSYDVENKRSVIHLSSTADTPLGKETWKNEAVFISQFSEDGKTLLRVDELYVLHCEAVRRE